MVERGVANTSIDAIASEAGVSKATVYRWWKSKEELVIDAVEHMRGELDAPPVTADPRADLIVHLRAALRRFWKSEGRGKVFPRLLDASVDSAELAEAWRRHLILPRRAAIAQILKRAIDTGDLPRETDVELAVDLLVAPLIYRLHVTRAPAPEELADRVVDLVWSGLVHHREEGN